MPVRVGNSRRKILAVLSFFALQAGLAAGPIRAGAEAEPAADLEAVEVGQAQVEEHEIGLRAHRGQPVLPGRRPGDVVALPAQGGDERLGDRCVVLHQQQSGHGRNLPRSGPPTGPAGGSWKLVALELPSQNSRSFRKSEPTKFPK